MERLRMPNLTPYLAFLLIVATLGPFLFGYHLAELNAPQEVLTCAQRNAELTSQSSLLPECIPMTTLQFSVVSSIFTLGGLIGALAIGSTAARHGRLRAMLYTTFFFVVGPIGEALATNAVVLGGGRLISGIGAGASLVVVPIYVSEICPTRQKGLFGSFTQVMVNMGVLITQLLGYFLSTGQLWRLILGVAGIIGLAQFAGLFFAVESPKWHLDHGHVMEAKRNLQLIRGPAYDIQRDVQVWGYEVTNEPEGSVSLHHVESGSDELTGENPDAEQTLLLNSESDPLFHPPDPSREATSLVRREQVSTLGVLANSLYIRPLIAVVVIMMAQQFTGINSIVMYGVALLSGLLQQSSALLNVCVAAINVVVTILCAPLSDKLGRKPCLLISISGMGISSLLLAVSMKNDIQLLAAITTLTFVASFAVGLGPLPFLLASELVGPEAVSAIQSWALATNWISTFIVAQFFPLLNRALGSGNVYYLFAILAVVFIVLVTFCVPETKDKTSYEEIWR